MSGLKKKYFYRIFSEKRTGNTLYQELSFQDSEALGDVDEGADITGTLTFLVSVFSSIFFAFWKHISFLPYLEGLLDLKSWHFRSVNWETSTYCNKINHCLNGEINRSVKFL